jgi:lysophospholipase L1-like esterase
VSGASASRPLTGRLLAAGAVLVPGIGKVHSTIRPFAAAWDAANASARAATGPLWVALGDSMSQGIGAASIDDGWTGQLLAGLRLDHPDLRIVNLSRSGARVRDVVEEQLPRLAELAGSAAVVTVLVGANDMLTRARRRAAVPLYRELLQQLPAGRAVVALLPRRNREALAINDLILDAARRATVRVADPRGLRLRDVPGTLAADFFHPNERGYARLASNFQDPVRAVLDSSSEEYR